MATYPLSKKTVLVGGTHTKEIWEFHLSKWTFPSKTYPTKGGYLIYHHFLCCDGKICLHNVLYVNISTYTSFWNGAVGYFVTVQSSAHLCWLSVCLTPPCTPSGVEVIAAIAAWSSVSIEADGKRLCCSVFDSALQFSSVQLLSLVWLFVNPCIATRRASLSSSWSLLKLMSIQSVMPSNYLILCHPLLFPPSIFPSIRVFSKESILCSMWPKFWSFSFNISPSNEHLGLISFRMDCLDLLAVQGTLKSLLQHHSSKASILQCSAFFIVQLSHPYHSFD